MPAKIVLSLIVLALVGGGVALAVTGGVVKIAAGVVLAGVGLLFAKVAYGLLRNPEAATAALNARKAELEARAARSQQ